MDAVFAKSGVDGLFDCLLTSEYRPKRASCRTLKNTKNLKILHLVTDITPAASKRAAITKF